MDFEFIEDFHTDPISGKSLNSMDDSELKKQSLHIKELYSKVLDEINKSVQAKNYDYCAAGVTRMQGVLEWKKTVVCGDGKLYAGVQIQDKSFRITVEPFADFENWKEKYSFEDKNNSEEQPHEVTLKIVNDELFCIDGTKFSSWLLKTFSSVI